MTERDLTRSLIYLNLHDVDGLIDIARNREPLTELQTELVQRLATTVVTILADDQWPIPKAFEGRIALAVLPLAPLPSLPAALALVANGGQDHANN